MGGLGASSDADTGQDGTLGDCRVPFRLWLLSQQLARSIRVPSDAAATSYGLPAPRPCYPLRRFKYPRTESIRPSIEVHWGC